MLGESIKVGDLELLLKAFKQYYIEVSNAYLRSADDFNRLIAEAINELVSSKLSLLSIEFRQKGAATECRILTTNNMEVKIGRSVYESKLWIHVSVARDAEDNPEYYAERILDKFIEIIRGE